MKEGIITIKLEGVEFKDTERCRKIIHTLFELGFFNIKNGSFTANFDSEGQLSAANKTYTWRNAKPLLLVSGFEQFTVELNEDNSTVAKGLTR